ncbi:SIMPL domain-containing protein [Pseudonocardia ailaonensis]|uniref:SIMPL domain-containing protein n=1 Tax=Pseudonocardia ailaonensis TaxID=367279 RepID=A0ABN2NS46_9PSEU
MTEGSGWVERTADRAELGVVFDARGRTRAAAVEELGRRVARAEKALGLSGLTVRSRRLSVHTEYRSSKPSGCRASEFFQIEVDDVAVLEEALSLLLGAEPASVSGPSWSLAHPEEVVAQAQQRAVADARRRAEGYAAALGGTLGPLRRLSEAPEHGGGAPMYAMRASARAEGGPDVSDLGLEPEPVRVSARCTTSWQLNGSSNG